MRKWLWAVKFTRHNLSRYFTQYPPPPPPPPLRPGTQAVLTLRKWGTWCSQSLHNKVASSDFFCSKASKLFVSLRARSSFRVASEARRKRTRKRTVTTIRVPSSRVTVRVSFSRGSTIPPKWGASPSWHCAAYSITRSLFCIYFPWIFCYWMSCFAQGTSSSVIYVDPDAHNRNYTIMHSMLPVASSSKVWITLSCLSISILSTCVICGTFVLTWYFCYRASAR